MNVFLSLSSPLLFALSGLLSGKRGLNSRNRRCSSAGFTSSILFSKRGRFNKGSGNIAVLVNWNGLKLEWLIPPAS